MNELRNILIIRLSSLGDLLHTVPALRSLRNAFPTARIDWLVEKRTAFLLSAVPGIDAILEMDTASLKKSPFKFLLWKQAWDVIRTLRARHYDVSLDFQGLLKTGLLSLLSGSRVRLGFSKELVRERPASWFYHRTLRKPETELHVVHLNLLLAQAAGGDPGLLHADLKVDERAVARIRSWLDQEKLPRFVVINPGGGWPTKRWEPARYGALAERIQSRLELPVVVTTGPGEEGIFEELSRYCANRPPRHLQVRFLDLAPLFQRARLVIAGDTGPFHLACLLGVPVVGIFGPTSPVRNGAWSEPSEVVVHQVPCSFCYGRSCPTENECMNIAVDEVFAAVVRCFEKKERP